jgi:hypothetical protein
MAQDDVQSKKLKDIEERQNKYLARRIEESDAPEAGQTAKQDDQENPNPDDVEYSADILCRECSPPHVEVVSKRGGSRNAL